MNYSMQKHSMQTRSKSKSKSKSKSSGSRRSSVGSASTHSMQTRSKSKSKSSGSRHSSVGSAITPLTKRQKQMLSEAKRRGLNNSQLRRNKLELRFIPTETVQKRVSEGQEAKNARDMMTLRELGLSRTLGAEYGVISPFNGIKRKLFPRSSKRNQKNVKGSVTKKSKGM